MPDWKETINTELPKLGTGIVAQGAAAAGAPVAGKPVLVAGSDGTNARTVKVSSAGVLNVSQGAAAAADVLNGYLAHGSTTAAETLITVPAGRTWKGTITLRAAGAKAAAATGAGEASGLLTTAGAGVVPPAGNIMDVAVYVGANAATGVTGTQDSVSVSLPQTIIAPAGNAVTVKLASTVANLTAGSVAAMASGELI